LTSAAVVTPAAAEKPATVAEIMRRGIPPDPVTVYAIEVLAGREIAGPYVRAACQRHLNDLKYGPARGLWFDPIEADRVFTFFQERLRLTEGQFEGTAFQLHPSQQFVLGSIYGWMRKNQQGLVVRRFQRAYIEMGKGNGKSPLVGGMGLYGMIADKEPGAQIYSCGATYDQASILFQDAVKMAEKVDDWNDPDEPLITYSGNQKVFNMAVLPPPQAHSFFRPISRAKGKTGSGPRPHMALCDELHEHPDGGVIEMLERGFKFRRQPLLIMITNSGSDRRSVCWAEHEHAVKVAQCDVRDDRTFSYVCALDDGDDPFRDPSCWKKANPLLGVTITTEYLGDVVQQGLQIAGKQNNILRLHFCVWTDSAKAWISRKKWESCEDLALTRESMKGRRAYGGLDLSQTKDLTAKAWVFEDGFKDVPAVDEKGQIVPDAFLRKQCYALIVDSYTPAETMQAREEADRTPYSEWTKDGYLKATPGPIVRLDIVANDLIEDNRFFDVVGVAYDQFLIRDFQIEMDELNAPAIPMHDHPQGTSYRKGSELFMPRSVDMFETLILEGRLRVHVNPVLRTAVAGATFWKSPAGLKRFTKDKATNRIDPAVAAAMAIGLATLNEPDASSIWNKLGADEARKVEKAAKAVSAELAALVNSTEIDYKILNDRDHPLHATMVQRWNEFEASRDYDDDY
jgi:phage terminase large subunit-like protein